MIKHIKTSNSNKTDDKHNRSKYVVLTIYALSLIIYGLILDKPMNIINGLYKIFIEPDLLITDYIGVGGIGAAFVNSGLLTLISILLLYILKININGTSIAAVFLMAGFSLFGKNLLNVWPIIIGVFLFSKLQKDSFSKYIYIALFGTSMAPTVTQVIYGFGFPVFLNVLLGIFIGIGIGFFLQPLSIFLVRVHQGYNLYNIGFTAGLMGTILVSLLKSYGFKTPTVLIWTTEYNMELGIYLVLISVSMIIMGYHYNDNSFKNFTNIFTYSGRLVTDFVFLEGFGATLINMGINGLIGITYILLIKGNLNGPTVGGIFTLIGFGAFGKHAKNITPIFIGVALGSLTKIWNINDPAIQLAALFGTTLAPIAGTFGWKYGILAGFIHSSVVLNVGTLHGGLNLYNNGFAGGLVAAVLVPIIETFRKEEENS